LSTFFGSILVGVTMTFITSSKLPLIISFSNCFVSFSYSHASTLALSFTRYALSLKRLPAHKPDSVPMPSFIWPFHYWKDLAAYPLRKHCCLWTSRSQRFRET